MKAGGTVLFYVLRLQQQGPDEMKLAGFLLLLAGWGLVLAALALLTSPSPRTAFVLAGVGVEVLGLVLVVRTHQIPHGEKERG
jgi:FtsH-binding integral membrane protein